MKEYKLEDIIDNEGILNLKFMEDNKQIYEIHIIEQHPNVNKEALEMLHCGTVLLIEGKDGDSLEDLHCKGIRSIYIKMERGNMPLYITKENDNKKKSYNTISYAEKDSDNTLLS